MTSEVYKPGKPVEDTFDEHLSIQRFPIHVIKLHGDDGAMMLLFNEFQ
jgi:hypothetical protein